MTSNPSNGSTDDRLNWKLIKTQLSLLERIIVLLSSSCLARFIIIFYSNQFKRQYYIFFILICTMYNICTYTAHVYETVRVKYISIMANYEQYIIYRYRRLKKVIRYFKFDLTDIDVSILIQSYNDE